MKNSFKNGSALLAFVILASLNANAGSVKDVKSLRDLPSQWSGEAGNLIQRTSASLQINKILAVLEQSEKDSEVTIRYAIDGIMTFGERKIELKEVSFSNRAYTHDNEGILSFKLNDNFVPSWSGFFHYDEVKNQFILRDYQSNNRENRVQLYGSK